MKKFKDRSLPKKTEQALQPQPEKTEKSKSSPKRLGKRLLRVFLTGIIFGLVLLLSAAAVNLWMVKSAEKRILSPEDAAALEDVDCVLVLGCLVYQDGSLSHMLRDRMLTGIDLVNRGASDTLLVSGDHGRQDYNEVGYMKRFAMDHGISSERIFMDHAGFSTYDTMYRAKEVFLAKRVLIVTQSYHLPRALYTAKKLGLEAWGVSADLYNYRGQTGRDIREFAARCKDFLLGIVKPLPKYLGEEIPISEDGNLTNDDAFLTLVPISELSDRRSEKRRM